MPTETFGLQGPKRKHDTLREADAAVAARYPKACGMGSLGHRTYTVADPEAADGRRIVAEAWAGNRRGWWTRIAEEAAQ